MKAELKPLGWGIDLGGDGARWGARAIYMGDASIDLLWDRQDVTGGEAERKALLVWVNRKGLLGLKRELHRRGYDVDSEGRVEYREGGYLIVADARRSFGYLYIGAAKE